jgi:hypothetical protein
MKADDIVERSSRPDALPRHLNAYEMPVPAWRAECTAAFLPQQLG